jgi:hypothetical protein
LQSAKAARKAWEAEQAAKAEQRRQREEERDLERRLNPRTVDDFDLLYHSLEQWRLEELAQLESLPEAERRAARLALLHKQCEYLSSIERLKLIADEENRERRIDKFMEQAAAPRAWRNSEYKYKVSFFGLNYNHSLTTQVCRLSRPLPLTLELLRLVRWRWKRRGTSGRKSCAMSMCC